MDMIQQAIEVAPAARAAAKFTIDAAPLAKALVLLAAQAPAASHHYGSARILSHVLFDVDEGGEVTLTATNLDSFIRLQLDARCEVAGRFCVPAVAMRDGVKKVAKDAHLDFAVADGKVHLASGRTRLAYPLGTVDDFPVAITTARDIEDEPLTPSEQWGIVPGDNLDAIAGCRREGLVMDDDTRKLLAKFVKFVGAVDMTASRFDPEDKPCRYVIAAMGGARASFGCFPAEPAFAYWKPQRSRFTFELGDGYSRAIEYLRDLRSRLGLPGAPDGNAGQLLYRDGLALGMTFGEGFYDQSGYRHDETPEDWTPPDGTTIEDGTAIVDGRTYHDLGFHLGSAFEGRWCEYHFGCNAFTYPEGAYTLLMPRSGVDRCVAADYVAVGDDNIPLGKSSGGAINLTADQVRELCGPVDPSTFVDIKPIAFHHGAPLAAGWEESRPLKVMETNASGRHQWRRMTDREVMNAYCDDPAGTIENLRPKPTMEALRFAQDFAELAQLLSGWHVDAGATSATIIPFPTPAAAVEMIDPPSAETDFAAGPPVRPVEEAVPETAVCQGDAPARSCEAGPAEPEAPIEADGEVTVAMFAELRERIAALEAAPMGGENVARTQPEEGNGSPPSAETADVQNRPVEFQRERRLRIVRAYLRMRADRDRARAAVTRLAELRLAAVDRQEAAGANAAKAARIAALGRFRMRDVLEALREARAKATSAGSAERRAEDAEFKAADLARRLAEAEALAAKETARADSADGRWQIVLDDKQARIVALENEKIERLSGGRIKLTTPLRANARPAVPLWNGGMQ
jgi:hypothetical protein